MDNDPFTGCECVQRRIGDQFDRNGAGNNRGDCARLVDAVVMNQHADRSFPVVTYKTADPLRRLRAWHGFIVECQQVVARSDAPSGCGGRLGHRQDGRPCPTHRKCFVGVRSKLARQARYCACFEANLCRSNLAVAMICRPDAERDIVEAPALVEVVADVVDLLFASLGLDLFGGQWRKLRNRSARRAKQTACDQKHQTPTHTDTPRRAPRCINAFVCSS